VSSRGNRGIESKRGKGGKVIGRKRKEGKKEKCQAINRKQGDNCQQIQNVMQCKFMQTCEKRLALKKEE
jgi:hypothetical protein